MGSAFGKMDPNATNDVLGGQTVATGTPGATTVRDPNQGLTAGQMFTRKALAGGLAGAGQALQRQSGQQPTPFKMQQPITSPMQPPSTFNMQPPQTGMPMTNSQPPVPPQNTGTSPVGTAGINGSNNPFPKGPRGSLFYGAPGGF